MKPPLGLLTDLTYGAGDRRLMHTAQPRRGIMYRYYLPSTVCYRVAEHPLDRYRAADLEDGATRGLTLLADVPFAAERDVAVGEVRRLGIRINVDAIALWIALTRGAVTGYYHQTAGRGAPGTVR